jgi:hypothetical protein
MVNARRILVAATLAKAKTYVFAEMVIHNPKVGGSIPPPRYQHPLNSQYLQGTHLFSSKTVVANLCPEQTARNV